MLYNATVNRRAKFSPYVSRSSIDPHLGVFRVDDLNGKSISHCAIVVAITVLDCRNCD